MSRPAAPPSTTRDEFLREYMQRLHDTPSEGVVSNPPHVGVSDATVRAWMTEAVDLSMAEQASNGRIMNAFMSLAAFRAPTQIEQDAFHREVTRGYTLNQQENMLGVRGNIAHTMRAIWETRHGADIERAGRQGPSQLLRELFDPARPLLPDGPTDDHYAEFRALNPAFGPSLLASQYYLRLLYSCARGGEWEGVGPVPVQVANTMDAILTHFGGDFHRVFNHLSRSSPDPVVQTQLEFYISTTPAEMAEHKMDDDELVVEDGVPFLALDPDYIHPAAVDAEDLQRLLNEWERDVSPEGVVRRNTQLDAHLRGLPSEDERVEATRRIWMTHPNWLTLHAASTACTEPETMLDLVKAWASGAAPDRPTILAELARIKFPHVVVSGDHGTVLGGATNLVLLNAKAASLHHWPCIDDTLFVRRLVELNPEVEGRLDSLRQVFRACIPYADARAPSMDEMDWDRFYEPLVALVVGDEVCCNQLLQLILNVGVGDPSRRLQTHVLSKVQSEASRKNIVAVYKHIERANMMARCRMDVSMRLAAEKDLAPKPDAPIAIHRQLAQLEVLSSALKESASADENKALVGNIRSLVHAIGSGVEKDSACIICMERERRVRYDPCGHVLLCNQCSVSTLAAQQNRCPKCRAVVDRAQPVFM